MAEITRARTDPKPPVPDWLNPAAVFPEELFATLGRLNAEAEELAERLRRVCVESHDALAAVRNAAHTHPGWRVWGDDTYQLLLDAVGAENLWCRMEELACDANAISNSPPFPPAWLDDRSTPWRRGAQDD
jgi:hypothetical protein